MIVAPCSDRMLSGWNCTPWTGSDRWDRPMTSPSAVSAVTCEVGRAGLPVDDEGMVAGRLERAVDAPEHRLPHDAPPPRPCRAWAEGRGRPCRRTPGRWPAAQGRRRRSGSSGAARSTRSRQMPASFGVHGPGDSTMASGAGGQHLVRGDGVVAHHLDRGRKRADQVHQVPGEAVVIVDDENAGHGAPTFAQAADPVKGSVAAVIARTAPGWRSAPPLRRPGTGPSPC